MKRIEVPVEFVELGKEKHTCFDLLEDIVLTRAAWRDAPESAAILFAALDEGRVKGFLRVPDREYELLARECKLDPGSVIQPRSANRLFHAVS